MALIGITCGDDLPDDCTIVIHKPAVPDERMDGRTAGHVMLEQAELLADALVKYLPSVTLMALGDALDRRIHAVIARRASASIKDAASVREAVTGWSLLRDHEQAKSASADRGYDTLSCGHTVTRFSVADGKRVPLVSWVPLDDSGVRKNVAWCGECDLWIEIDPQQATELARESREATT